MTLDGAWKGSWYHPGTPLDPDLKKVPKIIKKIPFLDLILETFFSKCSVFFIAVLNCVLGNPPNRFLKDCWVILSQFLEWFSQLFEETGNLEKCNLSHAKPLFFSIQRQGFSSFFHAFSKTSSRAGILSNFDRILAIWGLHLETFGCTFGGHFSGHKKVKRVFWGVLLGRGYLGPLQEKGETERHLEDI